MMTETQFLESFRKQVEDGLKLWETPAISIGIIKDGRTVLCEGFGMRDAECGLPATGDTLYQIGSCTKAFTAAMVAILVDQGKLSWDEPIVNYMPEVRFFDDHTTATLTMRDILLHRSGLPRHEFSWYGTDFTRAQLVHNLRYLEPNQPLRARYQYNNYGYILAGYIVETLMGKPFEQCLQEYLLEPLGMKRSHMFVDLIKADSDHAEPYERPDPAADQMKGMKKVPFYQMAAEDPEKGIGSPNGPAGAISSSAAEMLRWVAMHLNGGALDGKRIISEASMRQLHQPQILLPRSNGIYSCETKGSAYALGWVAETYRGCTLLQHGGKVDGFTSYTCMMPELNLGVVAYTNLGGSMLAEAMAHEVFDYYLGVESCGWTQKSHAFYQKAFTIRGKLMKYFTGEQQEGTRFSHPLEAYAGTYTAPGYMPVRIRLEDGCLSVQLNKERAALRHYHYDTFVTESVLGGGEIPPGLPLQFRTENFRSGIQTLLIPLCEEPGTAPIRFVRVKETTN